MERQTCVLHIDMSVQYAYSINVSCLGINRMWADSGIKHLDTSWLSFDPWFNLKSKVRLPTTDRAMPHQETVTHAWPLKITLDV